MSSTAFCCQKVVPHLQRLLEAVDASGHTQDPYLALLGHGHVALGGLSWVK